MIFITHETLLFPALPPAVAHMVKKYQAAAAAFMPPAPAAAPGAA